MTVTRNSLKSAPHGPNNRTVMYCEINLPNNNICIINTNLLRDPSLTMPLLIPSINWIIIHKKFLYSESMDIDWYLVGIKI